MLEVQKPPLSLVEADLIVVKLKAENKIGWGEFSEPNTSGQLTELKP